MLHHLVGLLGGVALAPVLWVAAAWSSGLLPRFAEGEVSVATVSSAVVLGLLGAVCAYLVASRLSPLVAGASGALLTVLSLWPVAHPASMEAALSWLNEDSFLYPSGAGLAVALPLGTLLLFSAAMPVRWRAAVDGASPSGGRVVARASREEYRRGTVGDTVPDAVPDVPAPAHLADEPAADPAAGFGGGLGADPGGFEDDPDRTTTPFHRGENGTGWTPLDGGGRGPRFGRRR
ncbi:YIP1 family protein [Nocardiopsis deserti]|uniref:YIP1 family protein n=1 Tax=Nocardiopsis deserti TaxID=2605988 RepID=UPI00123B83AB|nr:YIP1 family protein [Nocardiopsis deserti]